MMIVKSAICVDIIRLFIEILRYYFYLCKLCVDL